MRVLLFFLLLGFSSSEIQAKTTRFEVKDAAFRNLVQWTSDATLEKTVATSRYIIGWLELDPQNLKAGIKGELEVDVRSFEMGPESRQVKLRETLLAAADHPGALYKVDQIISSSQNELTSGKAVSGKVSGMLSARGIMRRHQMAVVATYLPESEMTKRRLPGNLLKVSASCDLNLSDYKFSIPDTLVGLLAPVLRLTVDVAGTDQIPALVPVPSAP